MKKIRKRTISTVITLIMVVTMIPLLVNADSTTVEEDDLVGFWTADYNYSKIKNGGKSISDVLSPLFENEGYMILHDDRSAEWNYFGEGMGAGKYYIRSNKLIFDSSNESEGAFFDGEYVIDTSVSNQLYLVENVNLNSRVYFITTFPPMLVTE